MGAMKEAVGTIRGNYFPGVVCAGVVTGALDGGTGCGELVGAPPFCIILSVDDDFPGRKKILMIKQSTTNNAERYIVAELKKSEVRRTPNIVPIELPPSVPANPPPLLDCIRTTIISRMETIISINIKIQNMI